MNKPVNIVPPALIGTQVSPPFRRVFQIAVQGVRIRLGRALVTLAGVALGIAFLMSAITTQYIHRAVAQVRDLRQQVNLMDSVLKNRVGSIHDKQIAIVYCGTLSPVETAYLERLRAAHSGAWRTYVDAPMAGKASRPPGSDFSRGAVVVLLLGDAPHCSVSLVDLTHGMPTQLVLDSRTDRQCILGAGVRRELFFGRQFADQRTRQARRAAADTFRTRWIMVISLMVTVIGVTNALLMSVTERFREIGTLKCLGALSSFIRCLFLIESALIGMAGSIIGVLAGALLTMLVYACMYGFTLTFGAMPYGELLLAALGALCTGTFLSVLAAFYPAQFASRMVPAAALRNTI